MGSRVFVRAAARAGCPPSRLWASAVLLVRPPCRSGCEPRHGLCLLCGLDAGGCLWSWPCRGGAMSSASPPGRAQHARPLHVTRQRGAVCGGAAAGGPQDRDYMGVQLPVRHPTLPNLCAMTSVWRKRALDGRCGGRNLRVLRGLVALRFIDVLRGAGCRVL